MVSETQTAQEIVDGDPHWFSVDPNYQHPPPQKKTNPGTYGPGPVLMKQLNSCWAGNLLIASCQSQIDFYLFVNILFEFEDLFIKMCVCVCGVVGEGGAETLTSDVR